MRNLIPEIVWQKLLRPNGCSDPRRVQGGLSQSFVFRCSSPAGPSCLRGWPSKAYPQQKLDLIVAALSTARDSGIHFVPAYFYNSDGSIFVDDGQLQWELTEWLPGSPNYLANPSPARLESACRSLADIHAAWSRSATLGCSPAVRQRCDLLAAVLDGEEVRAWRPKCSDEVERTLIGETVDQVNRHASNCFSQLLQISSETVTLHSCIRDIRCEHVLFTGERVTGIVDFGALRIDEPATDLARLLGTCEPLDHHTWLKGFESYCENTSTIQLRRVAILDYASCLLSAVQWARWLVVERRAFPCAREQLLDRWQGFLHRLRNNDWQALTGGNAHHA